MVTINNSLEQIIGKSDPSRNPSNKGSGENPKGLESSLLPPPAQSYDEYSDSNPVQKLFDTYGVFNSNDNQDFPSANSADLNFAQIQFDILTGGIGFNPIAYLGLNDNQLFLGEYSYAKALALQKIEMLEIYGYSVITQISSKLGAKPDLSDALGDLEKIINASKNDTNSFKEQKENLATALTEFKEEEDNSEIMEQDPELSYVVGVLKAYTKSQKNISLERYVKAEIAKELGVDRNQSLPFGNGSISSISSNVMALSKTVFPTAIVNTEASLALLNENKGISPLLKRNEATKSISHQIPITGAEKTSEK